MQIHQSMLKMSIEKNVQAKIEMSNIKSNIQWSIQKHQEIQCSSFQSFIQNKAYIWNSRWHVLLQCLQGIDISQELHYK